MRGWVYPKRTPVTWVYPRRKSRINPSMGQLMVEGGMSYGKVVPSLQHLMADKKSRPTIVMYVCERKSSV